MLTNYSKINRKKDLKILTWIILGFLFVVWLCTPPGNKFLQICFWGNNTKRIIAKVTRDSSAYDYLFYRNNAIYLAKMYPKDATKALSEINKAVATFPIYGKESELKSLYKDRAYIRLYYKNYQGALNDFINSDNITFNDYLTVAMLFKEVGNYKESVSYCNSILNTDITAYAGYACLADIYTTIGRGDAAIKVWNFAIDKRPRNARFYADRALVKKSQGDLIGYEEDLSRAKEFNPSINLNDSIIDRALNPKLLNLQINKIRY